LVLAPVCTADVVKEVSCVTVEVDVLTVVDVRVVRTVVADEAPLEAWEAEPTTAGVPLLTLAGAFVPDTVLFVELAADGLPLTVFDDAAPTLVFCAELCALAELLAL